VRSLFAVMLVVAAETAAWPCPTQSEAQWLGVPVWATDPNEGSTFGAMPIAMGVCPDDKHTDWLFAPSLTWNSLIHYTGTLRLYAYPRPNTSLMLIASMSTETNYNFLADYQHLPSETGAWTDEATAKVERTLFPRFFGIGMAAPASAEATYTMSRAYAVERRGINLGYDINIGALVGVAYDSVGDHGIAGLPLAPEVFNDVPGMMRPTAIAWQGLDVRYDNRPGGMFADSGLRVGGWAALVEGLQNAPVFVRAGAQANGVWPELAWLSGSARASWQLTSTSDAPFYDQSRLGGSYLLRGFADGRFVDREAWEVEFEQRIKLFTSHFFGVTADWRLDPFVAAGQVFDVPSQAFDKPQLAYGVGFRALVRPNVLGRIDVATGGEGAKVYVEIGYPY